MGLIDDTVPTIGDPNSTEDADVRNALVRLFALVNGNIDAANAPTLANTLITLDALVAGATGLAKGSFSAYRAAGYSSNGVPAKIPYDTEEWDHGGYFDVAAARFTPLVAGIYRLSAFQRVPVAGGLVYLSLFVYKNGLPHRTLDGGGAQQVSLGAGGSTLVAANGTTDYFEVWSGMNVGGSIPFSVGAAESLFQGELVGKV